MNPILEEQVFEILIRNYALQLDNVEDRRDLTSTITKAMKELIDASYNDGYEDGYEDGYHKECKRIMVKTKGENDAH